MVGMRTGLSEGASLGRATMSFSRNVRENMQNTFHDFLCNISSVSFSTFAMDTSWMFFVLPVAPDLTLR